MSNTVSISEAKQRLGEIADRALQGEQVIIVRKSKLLVLKQLEIQEPVPVRPHGYFEDCYDKASVKESNKLGTRSTRKIVKWGSGKFTYFRSRKRNRTRRLSSPTTSVARMTIWTT